MPPAYMGDPEEIIAKGQDNVNYKTALLLRDMLARSISQYHPDPLKAMGR